MSKWKNHPSLFTSHFVPAVGPHTCPLWADHGGHGAVKTALIKGRTEPFKRKPPKTPEKTNGSPPVDWLVYLVPWYLRTSLRTDAFVRPCCSAGSPSGQPDAPCWFGIARLFEDQEGVLGHSRAGARDRKRLKQRGSP